MNQFDHPISPANAKTLGFEALTWPYTIFEYDMLERACAQLGMIPYVIVNAGGGKVEIWRKSQGVKP